jgi:hypothetical protein
MASYQSNVAGHIVPFFGGMQLRDVTLPYVQEFIKGLLTTCVTPMRAS